MVSLAHDHDPYYRGEIAGFIRSTMADLWGCEVVADDSLTDRLLEINMGERVIKIRPGQPLRRFHHLVDRAWLYTIGGSSWVPEFRVQPRLRLITSEERPPTPHLCSSCKAAIGEG